MQKASLRPLRNRHCEPRRGEAISIILKVALLALIQLFNLNPAFPGPNINLSLIEVSKDNSSPNTFTITTTYSHPAGTQALRLVYLMIDTELAGDEAFFACYDPKQNRLYLRNDSGTNWLKTSFSPGTNKQIENSYSSLDCLKTKVSLTAATLTITWQLSFKPLAAANPQKFIYLYAEDKAGLNSSWQKKASLELPTTNHPPLAGEVSLINRSVNVGEPLNFTSLYADVDGANDLIDVYLMIDTELRGDYCFFARYNLPTNKLFLRNDPGAGWLAASFTPGSPNRLENSYAALDCKNTSVAAQGSILTVNWQVTFKEKFLQPKLKYVYAYAEDKQKTNSSWQSRGFLELKPAQPPIPASPPKILALEPKDKSLNYIEDGLKFKVTALSGQGTEALYRFWLDHKLIQAWQNNPEFSLSAKSLSIGPHSAKVEVTNSSGAITSQEIEIYCLHKPISP